MKRVSVYPVVLSLVVATAATAQSPITGTWVTDAFDGIPNLIDLEVNGSTVIGAISRNEGVYRIHDGHVSGETVTFKVTAAWGGLRTISFIGRLGNDVLSFTRSVQTLPGVPVTGGGQGIFRADGTMEFEAKRESAGATTIPRGMLGNWRLNLQRSTFDPGPVPQPMIAQTGTVVAYPGGWFTSANAGVNPNGAPFFSMYAAKTDGGEYPVYNATITKDLLMSGISSPQTVAVRIVDARTLEMTNRNNGRVTSITRAVVSPDGGTSTFSVRNMNAEGEVTSTNTVVWERLFSASPGEGAGSPVPANPLVGGALLEVVT